MKFYLASRYSRIDEMNEHRKVLEAAGNVVTSRWLERPEWGRMDDEHVGDPLWSTWGVAVSIEDFDDVARADMLIQFSDEPRTPTRGGKHVELGIALGLGMTVAVIGPKENVFHFHPRVTIFPRFSDFFATFSPVTGRGFLFEPKFLVETR